MSTSERLVVRPHRLTQVCVGLAVVVVVMFAVVAVALGNTPEGELHFELGDQVAMFFLGLLLAGGLLLLTRARVEADAEGVRVRNVFAWKALPWAVVTFVRFDDGNSWASLDLHDDDSVALLAVQANDGARAVDAVLALRRLHRASVGGAAPESS